MNAHRADGPAETPARIITDPATRKWLYGIAAAAIPLLVILGVLEDGTASAVLHLAAAILGLGTGGLAAANTPPADLTGGD